MATAGMTREKKAAASGLRQQLDRVLTGPPTSSPTAVVQTGPVESPGELQPPSWWRGDDDASQSSQVAAAQAHSRR